MIWSVPVQIFFIFLFRDWIFVIWWPLSSYLFWAICNSAVLLSNYPWNLVTFFTTFKWDSSRSFIPNLQSICLYCCWVLYIKTMSCCWRNLWSSLNVPFGNYKLNSYNSNNNTIKKVKHSIWKFIGFGDIEYNQLITRIYYNSWKHKMKS